MSKQCSPPRRRSRSLKPNQFEIRPGVIITERPILFQTEMVQANMEDRKTQTRRTKGLEEFTKEDVFSLSNVNGENIKAAMIVKPDHFHLIRSPFGQPGDLLWVRETFHLVHDAVTDEFLRYGYKADWSKGITSHPKNKGIWCPSIHMPKAASRIWAMVEDIRVERVQDISGASAIKEGVSRIPGNHNPIIWKDYFKNKGGFRYPTNSFASLWKSINGEDSWDKNPWVWVVQYRILSKTGRPSAEVILQSYDEIASCLAMTEKEAPHV